MSESWFKVSNLAKIYEGGQPKKNSCRFTVDQYFSTDNN
jgi:hypothetical protein